MAKTLNELTLEAERITMDIANVNNKITALNINGSNSSALFALKSKKADLVDKLAEVQHQIRTAKFATTHPHLR